MSQKAVAQEASTRIGGGIASPYELDPLDLDPVAIRSPKSPLFRQLPQKGNHRDSPVIVLFRQVDFVAEEQ